LAVEILTQDSEPEYQDYVSRCPQATYCHDLAWLKIIGKTYENEPLYLIHRNVRDRRVSGVLPGFFVTWLFGRKLVSLPYLDFGGILAAGRTVEMELLARFLQESSRRGAPAELRCPYPLDSLPPASNNRVGMSLNLEGLSESTYWKKLDGKVRNQVRKADKARVSVRQGRHELLDDFYQVFCRNMRDLGSPVHSRRLFSTMLDHLPESGIVTAYHDNRCIGGLFRTLWNDTLAIPWASTVRDARIHCPNNALYWESIRFAFLNGCRRVDLGRSARDQGTYRFKQQWLAEEVPLPWYQFDSRRSPAATVRHASQGALSKLTDLWSHLPLPIANVLGPRLRPHISA
jgi:FemAB-related protein (PEP-CTERM system-associated)